MMQSENLLRFFQTWNTDMQKPPQCITLTPTIVLKDNPTFYVAGDAFNWLARVKQWKLNIEMANYDREQQEYISKIDGNLVVDKKQYLGFSDAEMNSMSDIFSFFSRDITKECDQALPQSYQRIETLGKSDIFAPPLEKDEYDVSEIKKPDARQTQEAYNKLKREREQQEANLKKAISEFRNRH